MKLNIDNETQKRHLNIFKPIHIVHHSQSYIVTYLFACAFLL